MTKREGIWILWGFGLGVVVWIFLVVGFGMTRFDGRLIILPLAGAGLAYLAAKIMRTDRQTS